MVSPGHNDTSQIKDGKYSRSQVKNKANLGTEGFGTVVALNVSEGPKNSRAILNF